MAISIRRLIPLFSLLCAATFVGFSRTSVSAITSGVISADLALNLDPNVTDSYSGSGSTVTDISGSGRHGTLAGSPLPVFDNSGPKSFQFSRTYVGNTASSANKIAVNGNFLTDDFSIQTWIKTDQVGYNTSHYTTMYIMASECGGGANDWGLGVNNSGKLAFGAGPSDGTIATPETVNGNVWVNVAVSREKTTGTIKLYINGVLKATGTGYAGNSLTCSADGKTWIGNGQDAPAYSFGGKISSVLAYTRALSAADFLTNYNATVDTFYPVTYTISYNANGATSGSTPANSSFTTGGSATAVSSNSGSLARTGYTFAGWNTAANGSGVSYAAGNSSYSSGANVTLYAMWTLIPTTTTTTTTTAAPVLEIIVNAPASTVAPVATQPVGQNAIPTVNSTVASKSTAAPVTTIPSGTTTTQVPVKSTPAKASAPSIAAVSPGEAAVKVGDKVEPVVINRAANQLTVSAGPLSATVGSLDSTGNVAALDNDGNVRLKAGDVVRIKLAGFKAKSTVEAWLFSTPQLMGTAKVGADGVVVGNFVVPKNVPQGSHRIAIVAQTTDGKPATLTVGVKVGEWKKEKTITIWLIILPIVLAVFGAMFLPAVVRRRRHDV